jgi:peptide-methionine (R)-S-oxide reductase
VQRVGGQANSDESRKSDFLRFGFLLQVEAELRGRLGDQRAIIRFPSVEIPVADKSRIELTDDEWKRRLTPEEYRVLRRHGTEAPWAGCFLGTKDPGTYVCAGCGNPLFKSGEKFESGTGWPSFTQPIAEDALTNIVDRSFGMSRTEVRCARCDGHLGHVFPDGPPPTGMRYCINSVAMKHVAEGQPIVLVED